MKMRDSDVGMSRPSQSTNVLVVLLLACGVIGVLLSATAAGANPPNPRYWAGQTVTGEVKSDTGSYWRLSLVFSQAGDKYKAELTTAMNTGTVYFICEGGVGKTER